MRKQFPRVFNRVLSLSLVVLLTFVSIVLTQAKIPASEAQATADLERVSAQGPTSATAAAPLNSEKPTPSNSPTSPPPFAQPASQKPASPKPTPPSSPSKNPDSEKPAIDSDHFQKLAAADRLYQAGDLAAAEKIYREVKPPFSETVATPSLEGRPAAFFDPEQLSPAGRVFWREANEGIQAKTETRIFVPLKLLVEKQPEFMPGHLLLANQLEAQGKLEEAENVLERATSLYPDQPDLIKAKVALLVKTEKWLEASIAARQFALLHPTDPAAAEFTTLANENLKRYQKRLRSKLTGNLIGNIITGAVGIAITGNPFLALSSVQTTVLLLRGESAVGERFAQQAERQLNMLDDKETLDYVDRVGQKLAKAAGREEFKYEFHLVRDDELNAFALPGGKVFVNAGAIAKTNSEAELAGLLGHELSHAVLSHGFQLVTESSLTANVFQFVPYVGGLLNNLVVLNYSRDMERQADFLGTRLLATTDYAADGMRNLMVTLSKEDKSTPLDFLSSHPVTNDRVKYLETLIEQSGYNRYAYEGVAEHAQIKERVKKFLQEKKCDRKKNCEPQQDDKPESKQPPSKQQPETQPTEPDKKGNSL